MFVGRGPEQAELGRLLADALAGSGAVALITGEAGIGKSTLAARVADRATGAGTVVLRGRCAADGAMPAGRPWLSVLSGLPPSGPTPSLTDLDPPRVAAGILDAAGDGGVLVLIEDLQWADDLSRRILDHLAGEVSRHRLLVLGTARDADADAALPRARVVRLPPLSTVEVEGYLDGMVGGGVHASWPAYARQHSGGNPLYLRELVHFLGPDGAFGRPAAEVPIPDDVRRLVGLRLARLSATCRWLLGGCSVAGDEIDVPLLTAAAVEQARPRVPELLGEAVAAGVLVDGGADPARMRFSHDVVRQARYASLTRIERVDWERRFADAR